MRSKSLTSALAPFLSIILCHWIILPTAAWNHNMFLVIVAAIIPFIVVHVRRRRISPIEAWLNGRSGIGIYFRFAANTIGTAVIFWNHWWLLAFIIASIYLILGVRNARR